MSKKTYKSQASSSRASASTFGAQTGSHGIASFGSSSALGATASSLLSYIHEPLDLSAISEPNMIVAFKNLQKKDSATKSKALGEMQNYVLSAEAEGARVEEAIVEAWVRFFQMQMYLFLIMVV
jgi:E3 ubiquitin-protein ligase listerin